VATNISHSGWAVSQTEGLPRQKLGIFGELAADRTLCHVALSRKPRRSALSTPSADWPPSLRAWAGRGRHRILDALPEPGDERLSSIASLVTPLR